MILYTVNTRPETEKKTTTTTEIVIKKDTRSCVDKKKTGTQKMVKCNKNRANEIVTAEK